MDGRRERGGVKPGEYATSWGGVGASKSSSRSTVSFAEPLWTDRMCSSRRKSAMFVCLV